MKYGVIQAGDWRYRLTDRDVLWAGRMVEGETIRGRARREQDALAVLWTMTQLFTPAGQRDKYGRQRFADFTTLIRAYSQPINPLWLAGGHFCGPGGSAAGTDACAPERLVRRELLHRLPWRSLSPELRDVVLDWAGGRTDNPVPKATEFAAEYVAASFLERHPGSVRVTRIHNTFLATRGSRQWSALPWLEGPARATGAAGLPLGVAVVSAGIGAAVAWAIRQRRYPRRPA